MGTSRSFFVTHKLVVILRDSLDLRERIHVACPWAIWKTQCIVRFSLVCLRVSQAIRFARNWVDDSGLCGASRAGEGQAKVVDEQECGPATKPHQGDDYFTVKSAREVKVRKFRRKGTNLKIKLLQYVLYLNFLLCNWLLIFSICDCKVFVYLDNGNLVIRLFGSYNWVVSF